MLMPDRNDGGAAAKKEANHGTDVDSATNCVWTASADGSQVQG